MTSTRCSPQPGPAFEIGIGTGVVALGLHELGRPVSGIDIGIEMAKRAVDRIGPRVVQGDATCLPIRSGSIADVCAVMVLHLPPEVIEAEMFRAPPSDRRNACRTARASKRRSARRRPTASRPRRRPVVSRSGPTRPSGTSIHRRGSASSSRRSRGCERCRNRTFGSWARRGPASSCSSLAARTPELRERGDHVLHE